MNFLSWILCQFLICLVAGEFHRKSSNPPSSTINVMESSQEFWRQKAQNTLKWNLNKKLNQNKAKNVIFMLGDGMSFATVAATRAYMGGEEKQLSFEQFPHFGFSKTYCVDSQVADSACTSTAYLSGVKNNFKTIGVTANVRKNQCKIDANDHTESIFSWAQKACKATGIVTTARVTHASPAGAFAHISHRDWEHNEEIVDVCGSSNKNVKDIAYQLVHNEVGKNLKVILGGGRSYFINKTEVDEEGVAGLRTDGRNLINEWLEGRNEVGKAEYVWHKQQLDEIDVDKTDFLMGLFEHDHCMYNLDITNNNLENQEPSLTDMTVKAIKMLQKEENGYFLFVEGGRIDMAHHKNLAYKALEETKEFSRAIDVARKMTDEEDTLIVVTSDHSHVFTYNDNANRGSDVLGFAGVSDIDDVPYLTLTYSNGPAYKSKYDNKTDLHNPEFRHISTVPLIDDTHGGEDVGVYASGPYSHLFQGNYEQNNLPLLMAHAAEIGNYNGKNEECKSGGVHHRISLFVLITISIITIMRSICF